MKQFRQEVPACGVFADHFAALSWTDTNGLRFVEITERLEDEEVPAGGGYLRAFAIPAA
jgi:hypothetical protein